MEKNGSLQGGGDADVIERVCEEENINSHELRRDSGIKKIVAVVNAYFLLDLKQPFPQRDDIDFALTTGEFDRNSRFFIVGNQSKASCF